jgi:hypothetical protein
MTAISPGASGRTIITSLMVLCSDIDPPADGRGADQGIWIRHTTTASATASHRRLSNAAGLDMGFDALALREPKTPFVYQTQNFGHISLPSPDSLAML